MPSGDRTVEAEHMETLSDYRTSSSMEHERQLAIDAERIRVAAERAAVIRPTVGAHRSRVLAGLISAMRLGS